MDENCRYKVNENFEVVNADEDIFIMPNVAEAIIQEKVFTVGGIGRLIIEKIQENLCVKEIAASICAEYDVSAVVAERDLHDFLLQLLQNNIIEAIPADTTL